MVASWLPDPHLGRSREDVPTTSEPSVLIVDSDAEDHEANVADPNMLENEGYRLLNDFDIHADDDDDTDDDSVDNVVSPPTRTSPNAVILDDDAAVVSVSNCIQDSDQSECADARDIDVDYDQVRAIMARVTLPASAAPSWASAIPDSEWCAFLQDRIRTLQERDELPAESKSGQQNCG